MRPFNIAKGDFRVNEVLRTIFSRAGVKLYANQVPSRELLEILLKAGTAAPNAYNKQRWHFTSVTNSQILQQIDRLTFRHMVEGGGTAADSAYRPLHGAPALIIISSARDNPFAKQDCSCANQNIALAAMSLGLATRYLDIPNMAFQGEEGKKLKEVCMVPEGYETVCFLCVGYPADKEYKPTPKRENVISFVE